MYFEAMPNAAEVYARDGFLSPVDILNPEEAAAHRARMEEAEAKFGELHYNNKLHTILRSPYELATHPRVLDVVERLIGPDILLYNVTYIVKEPRSPAHVSWHQDLTYWGFNDDTQVSIWLALSPAAAEGGCLRMVPGSHRHGRREHTLTEDPTNVLFRGQTVPNVAAAEAVACPLQPGQASFHHGWTLHSSLPNRSDDRRIGLNAQYLAPHLRQTKHDQDTAILVRGADRFGHFGRDVPAETDLDPVAIERREALEVIVRLKKFSS